MEKLEILEDELNVALEDFKIQLKASNSIGDIDSSNYLQGKIQGVEIALDIIFNIRD